VIRQACKGRSMKVSKGTGRGPCPAVSCYSTTQREGLAQITATIDEAGGKPADGGKWGARWYAPGTYYLRRAGHPVAPPYRRGEVSP
jgi:hypothetical protein